MSKFKFNKNFLKNKMRKQNPESLYKVMKRFCGLTIDERKQMGLSARRRVEEIFDKKKVVEETITNL